MNTRTVTGPLLVMALALASTAAAGSEDDGDPRAASTVATAATAVADVSATAAAAAEGRGHFKKMMMNPYMLIPQLIALGFAPIVLANLKMMVMSALTINNMALNAAIFMTVRNMVFGPRPKIKYVNHGYSDHHHHDDQHHHHQHHRRRQHAAEPTSDPSSHPQLQPSETLRNDVIPS